jgi:8-amino-7-oxononanoate synthase
VHCSPPSAAAIAAAAHALDINRRRGEELRWRLAERVSRFRLGIGILAASPSLFPVQQLRLPEHADARVLHQRLWDRGIQTVLSRGGDGRGARIGFVLTARHEDTEIDRALAGLAELTGRDTHTRCRGGTGNGRSTDESRAAFHRGANASE